MKKTINLKRLADDPSCLSDYDPNAMDFAKVHEFLDKFLTPISASEKIPIQNSLGRVIAKDVKSTINVPNYDNSAMDGYAIAFNNTGLTFKVTGAIYAGSIKRKSIRPGEAIQIMTGGRIPKGCDAVVPIELLREHESYITINSLPKKYANIRNIGEDVKKGEIILTKGHFIRPAEIGLLASLGLSSVNVLKKLKVIFFSSGDEVIPVGGKIKVGQVYDSNRYSIQAMLERLNIDFTNYKNVLDDKGIIKKTLLKAAKSADLIITSGGVSVGKADYMKEVLSEIGQVLFWKLSIKPGRPLAYGKIMQAHYFGLPGNPVSSMVTFYQIVQPAIKKIMGQTNYQLPPYFRAKCIEPIKKRPGRMEFQRGVLIKKNNEWIVQPTANQGSGILSSMTQANCFIVLDKTDSNIEKNTIVNIQIFDGII